MLAAPLSRRSVVMRVVGDWTTTNEVARPSSRISTRLRPMRGGTQDRLSDLRRCRRLRAVEAIGQGSVTVSAFEAHKQESRSSSKRVQVRPSSIRDRLLGTLWTSNRMTSSLASGWVRPERNHSLPRRLWPTTRPPDREQGASCRRRGALPAFPIFCVLRRTGWRIQTSELRRTAD